MFLVYYDETGDDGFPNYSSPIFVLTALYFKAESWKGTFEALREFRRSLKDKYGLPVKTELHTKYFLLNKKEYPAFGLSDTQRIDIIGEFCDFVASLDVQIVNTVINKMAITYPKYEVLKVALTYSVQRIENDLKKNHNSRNFLIITDDGRVGAMTSVTRLIQVFNPIPSIITPGTSYRKEIGLLIEDPLPKSSKDSYFIQISDMVSFIIYLHMVSELGVGKYANRMPSAVTHALVINWLDRLKPSLNIKAAPHPYGIVCYPK